ncbi:hypothetical protein [Thiolapillus sp.]|uniref:hypothetical protein n=1 Tax=Thiolapillus sp. TaxID=2017437 RepID=UPI002739B6B3|nr:hypothetical protein [Thiolapillus sp.]
MTRTAGAQIGCQRPSRFWGLGCPKIYHEAEDTLENPVIRLANDFPEHPIVFRPGCICCDTAGSTPVVS